MEPTTHIKWRIAATKGQNERGILEGTFDGQLCFFDMVYLLKEILEEGIDNYQEIVIECSEYTHYYNTYDGLYNVVENEDSRQTITLTADMLRRMY